MCVYICVCTSVCVYVCGFDNDPSSEQSWCVCHCQAWASDLDVGLFAAQRAGRFLPASVGRHRQLLHGMSGGFHVPPGGGGRQ